MKIKMPTITVAINTYNEEKNIADCVVSARLLTDTILVVDMKSTDKTVAIAGRLGARIVSAPFTSYVEPARQAAIENSDTDWVLILDADERLTPLLAAEIKTAVVSKQNTAYKVSRKNIFGKTKWLKHGGWWPDEQIRLIKKDSFRGWPKAIHSAPQIDGPMGALINPLTHFFHGDLAAMVEKTAIFEDIESDLLFRAHRTASTPTFFRKFAGELYRRLFAGLGFMDGQIGIIESIYQAYSKTITYLYLYEKTKSRSV
ncbi:glycosyltransferase family 2 protein [Candidatus Roizmanbacteria bacterium]|nr:glycosyltransferase family 2 protein [Candidatus Roizmanbacteria bacterium]